MIRLSVIVKLFVCTVRAVSVHVVEKVIFWVSVLFIVKRTSGVLSRFHFQFVIVCKTCLLFRVLRWW